MDECHSGQGWPSHSGCSRTSLADSPEHDDPQAPAAADVELMLQTLPVAAPDGAVRGGLPANVTRVNETAAPAWWSAETRYVLGSTISSKREGGPSIWRVRGT